MEGDRVMVSPRPEIHIAVNADELSRRAAAEFVRLAREAIQTKGSFTVALAGGSTPKGLYLLLADEASLREPLAWDRIHFFWGDERHVPPDHADSNYRMAHEAMLSKVPVPPANIHRVMSEYPDATLAADEYERTLRDFFQCAAGQFPRFDLVLLGMGPDGHTASLFPGTEALREQNRLVVANWVGKFKAYRITMTAPVFNHAACVIFLVSGEEKAETLRAVLRGENQPERFPSQLIQPANGRLVWLVDQAAARFLPESSALK
jgi:6-phosphogluconolactonase